MNILLLRLRLVGDVVFTTPAIRALRRHLPDARLTYLVEADAAPVVALNPHLDEVIVVRRSRGLARVGDDLRLARRLRSAHFDIVIDFHGGPRSAWLAWATGAPLRVGYTVLGRSWVYTRRVHRPRALRPRHSVANHLDLLAALGGPFASPPDPSRDAVEMAVDPAAAAALERRLAEARVTRDDRLIVMHVSARNRFRRWPMDSFVELCVALVAADSRRRIILTSGPSDGEAAARIREAARARLGPRAEAILGGAELDLAELRALLARAALFVGGDSGPLHVASTTAVPIVAIYGPTLPARSAPWRDPACVSEAVDTGELPCRPCEQRRCEPGDFRCLTRLTPDRVIAVAERVLERSYGYDHHNRRLRVASQA